MREAKNIELPNRLTISFTVGLINLSKHMDYYRGDHSETLKIAKIFTSVTIVSLFQITAIKYHYNRFRNYGC